MYLAWRNDDYMLSWRWSWLRNGKTTFLGFICKVRRHVRTAPILSTVVLRAPSATDILQIFYTAIPYRASTGPEQGFPCVVNSHREKPVFITGNPCSHCRDPVFITGNSLWELLHREIPVVITGNGFAVHYGSICRHPGKPGISSPRIINFWDIEKFSFMLMCQIKCILVLAECRVSEMVSWHMSSGKPKRFPMSFGD